MKKSQGMFFLVLTKFLIDILNISQFPLKINSQIFFLDDLNIDSTDKIISLGTKLDLMVSAWTQDLLLDIRIRTCVARGEDTSGIVLIQVRSRNFD